MRARDEGGRPPVPPPPRPAGWASICAAICTAAVLAAAACGGDGGQTAPADVPSPPAEEETVAEPAPDPVVPEDVSPPPAPAEPILWEVPITAADVGGHLVDSQFSAAVPSLIDELGDPELSLLPGRALHDAGIVFSPSPGSTTNETLWIHLITDETPEQASAWVRALAIRPASVALRFTSPQHDLFDALVTGGPDAGDESVTFELLRGHSGGRWRTTVSVFAQDTAIVFIVSPRRSDAGSLLEPEPEGARLTDVEAVARLISQRLARIAADPAR